MTRQENKVEADLYQIISGETYFAIKGKYYKIVAPSLEIRHRATRLYDDVYEKNKYEHFLTDQQCIFLLMKKGLCDLNVDQRIAKIEENLDAAKVRVYETFHLPKENEKAREHLAKIKENQIKFQHIRHLFRHLTLEGHAEIIKKHFLLVETLYDEENNRVFPSMEKTPASAMQAITAAYYKKVLGISDIRSVAKSEKWRGYWRSTQQPFGHFAHSLTDEQRILTSFNKMYDSVAEHPDAPPEEIVLDDDALDGWLIKQRLNKEQEKLEESVASKLRPHQRNAQEMFIVANNSEEAKKINNMNSMQAKIKKQQRKMVMQKHGQVKDHQFPDKQLEILRDTQESQRKRIKGK